MPGDIQLGNDYELTEDSNGNFVLTHTPSGSTLTFDSASQLFEFAAGAKFGDALTDTNGKTIYDVTTSTVGDGTTDANHDTVTVATELVDAAGVSHTAELADSAELTDYLLIDGTRAMSGALDMASNDIDAIGALDFNDANEPVVEQTAQTGTVTLDLSQANRFRVEADGDITIAFSNVSSSPKGNSVIIYFYDNDGTGPHTITYPTNTEWPNGNPINTIESNSNVEVALTSDDGDAATPTWRGSLRGRGFQ